MPGRRSRCCRGNRRFRARRLSAPGIAVCGACRLPEATAKRRCCPALRPRRLDGPLAVPARRNRDRGDRLLSKRGSPLSTCWRSWAASWKIDKRRWKVWDTAQQAQGRGQARRALRVRCIGSDPSAGRMVWRRCWYWPTNRPNGQRARGSGWLRRCERRRASNRIVPLCGTRDSARRCLSIGLQRR